MAMKPATALVLRTVDWSESSLIVTLFSREFGKVRAVAKGGRRPKGPFESALDVLSLCRVVVLQKSSDALDVLAEAKLVERFRPFDRGLPALHAGFYVAELVDAWTDDHDPYPALFDLALATLAELRPNSPLRSLVLHFELAALRHLGYFPALDECVHCGKVIQPEGRIPFSYQDGGVLCAQCRPGKRNVISLSEPAWRTLREFVANDTYFATEGVGKLKHPNVARERVSQLSLSTLGELWPVVNHYINHQLGYMPRTQAGVSSS